MTTAGVPLVSPMDGSALQEVGGRLVDRSGHEFPVVNGIPRFVTAENYAASFGLQWNRFRTTQLEGPDALALSRDRLFRSTAWTPESLSEKVILEVGSGAGRFSKVILEETRAELYSVDLSGAVDANLANNGPHSRLHLYQASIYDLPFAARSFDRVFCFGVLQHTPNFRRSVESLARMVRPGGELVVDFYGINGWLTRVQAKYILRPILRRVPADRLLALIERHVDWMLALSGRLRRLGLARLLGRFVPVADPTLVLPPGAAPERIREWAVLDTFDMFSPAHDHPQTIATVARWFEEFGVSVTFAGLVHYRPDLASAVVRGRRP